jgi:hypothetical protein
VCLSSARGRFLVRFADQQYFYAMASKTHPEFEPELTKNGRSFVAVKIGNGPDSHVGDFGSEADARLWIRTKSKYWPGNAPKREAANWGGLHCRPERRAAFIEQS